MRKVARVKSKSGDIFFVREEELPKIGTDQKVKVYEKVPRGCYFVHEGDSFGFQCVRNEPKHRIFIGTFLSLIHSTND